VCIYIYIYVYIFIVRHKIRRYVSHKIQLKHRLRCIYIYILYTYMCVLLLLVVTVYMCRLGYKFTTIYSAYIYIIDRYISVMVLLLLQLYTRICSRPIVMPRLSNGCHCIIYCCSRGVENKRIFFLTLFLNKRRRKKSSESNKYETPMCVARRVYFSNEQHFIYRTT